MKYQITKPNLDISKTVNPYLQTLVIKARQKTDFDAKDKDNNYVKYLVEDETITKVYTQSKLRLDISNLSPAATKLFTFIMYELEYNNPVLWFQD